MEIVRHRIPGILFFFGSKQFAECLYYTKRIHDRCENGRYAGNCVDNEYRAHNKLEQSASSHF